MNLDKHGIPILDSPREANKLKKQCPPNDHEWRLVKSQVGVQVDGLWRFDQDLYVCRKCWARDARTRAVDDDG